MVLLLLLSLLYENKNVFKNLILFSFFIGFGCGVRLALLMPILPVVLTGFYYLIRKYKTNYYSLVKRLSLHIPLAFSFVFLVVLCWPHVIVEINKNNFFEVFLQ